MGPPERMLKIFFMEKTKRIIRAAEDPGVAGPGRYCIQAGKRDARYPNQKIYGGKPALVH